MSAQLCISGCLKPFVMHPDISAIKLVNFAPIKLNNHLLRKVKRPASAPIINSSTSTKLNVFNKTGIAFLFQPWSTIEGCPSEIVYDQDRLFIVSENLGDIILTAGFRTYVAQSSFITHFCRTADPESMGKVENVVKYVKQNFLCNRSFKDLETLNNEAQAWLSRTANALEHGTTKKVPAHEYQIEKDFLGTWHPVIAEAE